MAKKSDKKPLPLGCIAYFMFSYGIMGLLIRFGFVTGEAFQGEGGKMFLGLIFLLSPVTFPISAICWLICRFGDVLYFIGEGLSL